jgi:hypothetical protein
MSLPTGRPREAGTSPMGTGEAREAHEEGAHWASEATGAAGPISTGLTKKINIHLCAFLLQSCSQIKYCK